MSTEKKVFLIALIGVSVLVLVLFSSTVVERQILPQPVSALVAVEVEGASIARTGRFEIPAGTSFQLHAVVQAETFGGETVYYTEANRLEIDGVEVPGELLRRWERSEEPRILWFTVEGYRPYLEVESPEQLREFHFQDNFRADWPRTWSIPGDLRPRAERDLKSGPIEGISRFGTQRFHVRVEFFGPKSQITPELRLQSPSAADLPAKPESVVAVTAALPEPMTVASRVYGLSQIEPNLEILLQVAPQLVAWYEDELTFSRLTVLKEHLDRVGLEYATLQWTSVELGADVAWGQGEVEPGDLLQVGGRWVILLQDRGVDGLLDRDDLCLDFDRGVRMRLVGEVFTGEGLVQWAGLG